MSDRFLDRLQRIMGLPWESPPEESSRRARQLPEGSPVAPPGEGAVGADLRPEDVRSAVVDAVSTTITRSLPGADVTVVIVPPEGDDLWVLEGRIWSRSQDTPPTRAVLVLGDHVVGQNPLGSDGRFRFEEVLRDAWTLEFHGAGRVITLSGPGVA